MSEPTGDKDSVNEENLTNEELAHRKALLDIEIREEKAETQKKMAWAAIISMIVMGFILLLPVFPDSRVQALGDLLGLFFISMAGVVGAFMGTQAWITKR